MHIRAVIVAHLRQRRRRRREVQGFSTEALWSALGFPPPSFGVMSPLLCRKCLLGSQAIEERVNQEFFQAALIHSRFLPSTCTANGLHSGREGRGRRGLRVLCKTDENFSAKQSMPISALEEGGRGTTELPSASRSRPAGLPVAASLHSEEEG